MNLNTNFQINETVPIMPEKAREILKRNGMEVTIDQAKNIVEFLTTLANIASYVYLDDVDRLYL
jgi:hypothetical protein